MLDDQPALFNEWYRLVSQHSIVGRPSYDTRLVAAMNIHRLSHILTFNGSDFAAYSGITILDPTIVTSSSQP